MLLTLSTLGKPKKSDKVKKKKKCRAKINLSGLKVEIAKKIEKIFKEKSFAEEENYMKDKFLPAERKCKCNM